VSAVRSRSAQAWQTGVAVGLVLCSAGREHEVEVAFGPLASVPERQHGRAERIGSWFQSQITLVPPGSLKLAFANAQPSSSTAISTFVVESAGETFWEVARRLGATGAASSMEMARSLTASRNDPNDLTGTVIDQKGGICSGFPRGTR
jgi:hypothetical protein